MVGLGWCILKQYNLGSVFISEKYVFRVCLFWKSFYEDDIQPEIQEAPPGDIWPHRDLLNSERNSHRWSPFTLGHHLPSPDGGSRIRSVIVSDPSIQIPHIKKVLRYRGQTAKSQAPKTPRTDTILPEHHLAHTLITYVYSHYCIRSFCHHFPFKNDVLISSTRIKFSNHENIAVAYTNFLSIASCRIVNVRYRNDLLVTEIRIANSAVRVRVVNSAEL